MGSAIPDDGKNAVVLDKKLLVAAIDLGTTYSGYAFMSYKDFIDKSPNKWSSSPIISQKTATALLLKPDKSFRSFGFEAEKRYSSLAFPDDDDDEDEDLRLGDHTEWYFFHRFKMILHNNQLRHDTMLEDETKKKLGAMTVFSECIRFLKNEMMKHVKRIFTGVKDTDFGYVLTVPAIWDDDSKQFMEEAAIQAGIEDYQLRIALEPEAASIYCMNLPIDPDENEGQVRLEPGKAGTKYLIADLGGRTADFTVYKKLSNNKFTKILCTSETSMGGYSVDKAFIEFLETLVGTKSMKMLKDEYLEDYIKLMREFELKKIEAGANKEKIYIHVPVALKSIIRIKDANFNGTVTIPKSHKLQIHQVQFGKFYAKTVNDIVDQFAKIMAIVDNIETIVVAGGFADCTLIHSELKEHFMTKNLKLVIPADPGLAVLKGAVLYGHMPESIFVTESEKLPREINLLDDKSLDIYEKALQKGKSKIHRMRLMMIGHFGVGKTTLTKGILQQKQKVERESTDGVDIYIGRCKIDLQTETWTPIEINTEEEDIYKRIAAHVRDTKPKSNMSYNDTIAETKCKMELHERYKPDNQPNKDKIVRPKASLTQSPPENVTMVSADRTDEEKGAKPKTTSGTRKSVKTQKRNVGAFDHSLPVFKFGKTTFRDLIKRAMASPDSAILDDKTAIVDIWDFGEQSVYYHTHQTFLSWRCIYTIVFDASKKLDEAVRERADTDDYWLQSLEIVVEYILFWINSIFTYAKGDEPGFPKIYLAATHLDLIPKGRRKQHLRDMFSQIQKRLESHPARSHVIIHPQLAINALDQNDPVYAILKNHFLHAAKSHPLWGEEIPTAWIPLEAHLMRMKQAGVKILSVADIEEINMSLQQPLPVDELEVFLMFHHSLGHILYIAEESLRQYVIIDPKFLVDAFRSIITAEEFCKHDRTKHRMWRKLSEEGLLEKKLVHQLWEKGDFREFADVEDHLLKMMEKLDIIAKPKQYSDDGKDIVLEDYFVPRMKVKPMPKGTDVKFKSAKRDVKFIVQFERNFLPDSIFHKLVANCLKMWPLLTDEDTKIIYECFAGFQLDECHILLVQKVKCDIHIFVGHKEIRQHISGNLWIGIQHFITNCLEQIIEVFDQTAPKRKSKGEKIYQVLVPCCLEHTSCLRNDSESVRKCGHKCQKMEPFQSSTDTVVDVRHKRGAKDCDMNCKGPPANVMSSAPNEQDFGRLSRRLITSPTLLQCALDIDNAILNHVEYEMQNSLPNIYFCLLYEWGKRCRIRKDPTYQDLLNELRGADTSLSDHIICKVLMARRIHESTRYEFLQDKMLKEPTDKELDEFSDRITPSEGFQLCIELGVSYVQLCRIRQDNRQSLIQIRKGLKQWKKDKKQQAKIQELVAAIDEINIHRVILREVFYDLRHSKCGIL